MTGGHVFHRSTLATPPVALRGEGIYVIDDQGRRYIDACGGAAVSCLGHGHPAILAAMRRTGRALRVTFNYRYVPHATKLRELMMQHTIGTPLHVDFTWLLDTSHGADYFRRWHRDKASSGGLLVHKSSHHFDLVNWWLDASPQSVFAMGGLKFYGRKNAESRGERYSYSRYTGQPEARRDPFALVLDGEHGEGPARRNGRGLRGAGRGGRVTPAAPGSSPRGPCAARPARARTRPGPPPRHRRRHRCG